mmetsp:Transcript_17652/g.26433  ORF Transcript_17652/g.26433 Transcript_17652/m.26433 type:complete len:247 (-) Transcript_17652:33-773(-)
MSTSTSTLLRPKSIDGGDNAIQDEDIGSVCGVLFTVAAGVLLSSSYLPINPRSKKSASDSSKKEFINECEFEFCREKALCRGVLVIVTMLGVVVFPPLLSLLLLCAVAAASAAIAASTSAGSSDTQDNDLANIFPSSSWSSCSRWAKTDTSTVSVLSLFCSSSISTSSSISLIPGLGVMFLQGLLALLMLCSGSCCWCFNVIVEEKEGGGIAVEEESDSIVLLFLFLFVIKNESISCRRRIQTNKR